MIGPWRSGSRGGPHDGYRRQRRLRVLAVSLTIVALSVISAQSQDRDVQRTQSAAVDQGREALWDRLMTGVAEKLLSRGGPAAQADDSSPEDRASEAKAAAPQRKSAPSAAATKKQTAVEEKAGQQIIKVGLNDRVTMHVADLPLAEAMRMLSEPSKRNIILADGVSGTVSASLYNVTFDEALQAMLVANRLGYIAKGDFVYVYPLEELAKMREAERKVANRVFRLTYINAKAAEGLIKPILSNAGKIAVNPPANVGLGGETGMGDTKGDAPATVDTLLVSDYAEKLNEVEKILSQLDTHPKQVLIEATIMRATLNEDNAMGIDFTTVGGIDFTQLSSVSPAAQSITTGNTPPAFLENTTFTARTDLNGGVPIGGFTFGIIKDQIGVFIRALEQITDTDVVANPKVLALNKQAGQVIVGRRDGYLTTTITETTAVQKVEFLETGTLLTFRPFVGDDGYVRMEIHPKDSTGGLTDAGLPFEQTTEVTTNILVKDGHTILIGGLFREVSTAGRGQVPLLGDIPIAGALFRRTRDNTVREEVIVLLTVHILKGEPEAEAAAEMREDVERYRVGMRQGMQWFSRERLAQAHYRWAMEHFQNGDLDRALWDARLAIHNYPRHIHAAKLKEKLLNKRNWDSDASSIRTYVQERIAEEQGIQRSFFGRPGPPFVIPEGLEGPAGLEEGDSEGADADSTGQTGSGDEAGTERARGGRASSGGPVGDERTS
jgi:type IV pilus assembly protein PilQ